MNSLSYKRLVDPSSRNEIYSSHKALFHTDRLLKLQKQQSISPTCIMVDLEAFCNDNCSFCTTRKENGYNNQMLKLLQVDDDVKKIVSDEFKPIGRPNTKSRLSLRMAHILPQMMKEAKIPAIELTGGGEPTLWPAFDVLIENLIKNKIEIGLVTNGSKIAHKRAIMLAENCAWIRFSMDASNKTLHKQIHRTSIVDFDRRVNSIRNIIHLKHDKLIVGISFVITPVNKSDIEKSCRFYKTLGVDHIRFTWMYDKTGNAGLDKEEIKNIKHLLFRYKQRYEDESFGILYEDDRIDLYSQPNNDFSTCYMQRFVWAIGADSNIYPCCIMKYNEKFAIGNIQKQTLKEILHDKYSREKMDNLNPNHCFPCWLRNKNKIISTIVTKSVKLEVGMTPQMHHNFI